VTGGAARRYDAIVIGGGHNALVCAAYLGRAGLSTLILERRETVGGALAATQIAPGASVPALAHTVGRLRASVARDLGLFGEGLRLVQPEVRVVSVRADGPPITLWGDVDRTAAELASLSRHDAAAWPGLDRLVRAHATVLERLALQTPPDPSSPRLEDALGALRLGLGYRGLRAADRRDLLRILPMAVADFLEDHLESDALRAAVAIRGMRYSSMGPHSAGSTQHLLADSAGNTGGLAGETVYARGGPGALAAALLSAARRLGAEVRTGAEVTQVRELDGRTTGVVLASGEELQAPIVVSGVDPKRLLLGMLDPEVIGPHLGWQAGNLRLGGVTAKVNLALSDLPRFHGLDGDDAATRLRGRILVAPSIAAIDRAADAAKYGAFPDAPWLEATIPSLVDPLLVDGGRASGVRHVMSVLLQSAPYALRDGGAPAWDARREELGDVAMNVLESVAPGIGALVVARQVLTPLDLERDYGLTGGHPLHGEPSLDQWFAWRPMLGLAQYRMPVEGLYLCGSGAHPGGGVTGLPGRNAAREILSDRKRSSRRA
jgi:phytoene dehydrogenase-like protein